MQRSETVIGVGITILSLALPKGLDLMWPGSQVPDFVVYAGVLAGSGLVLYGIFYDKIWGLKWGLPKMTDEKVNIVNHPVTSHGQSGGFTGNINIVTVAGRAQFTDRLKQEFLQKVPQNKKVHLETIGGDKDQVIGNEVHQFLVTHGYTVERIVIGIQVPPPSDPFKLTQGADEVTLTVAPSAH